MSNNTIPPSGRPQQLPGASGNKPSLLPTPESYELPVHSAIGSQSNGLIDALKRTADPENKLHATGHPLAKVAASLGTTEGVAQAGGAFTALKPQ